MSNHITAAAQASREQARQSDGKFGTQPHDRATGIDLTGTGDPNGQGIAPDRFIGHEIDLRAGKSLRLSFADAPCIGDGNELDLQRIGNGRAVLATVFHGHAAPMDRAEQADFAAFCTQHGADAGFDTDGSYMYVSWKMDTEREIRDLPQKLDDVDPGGLARSVDIDTAFPAYRERAVDERADVIESASATVLQSAVMRLEDEAFEADGTEAGLASRGARIDGEQLAAAEKQVSGVLEREWWRIEDVARDTGMPRRQIASAVADGLMWDSDWTAGLPSQRSDGKGEHASVRDLTRKIHATRGPFQDQSPYLDDDGKTIRFE